MSVPNIATATTRIKASAWNANFAHMTDMIDKSGTDAIFVVNTTSRLATMRDTGGTRTMVMGVDANDPYLGSSSNHSQRFISNNIERMRLEASGPVTIRSGNTFKMNDSSNVNYMYGTHNGSDAVLAASAGAMILAGTVVRSSSGAGIRSYESGNTNYTEINQQGGSYGQVITNAGNFYVGPSADGNVVILGRTPRRLDTTNTYINAFIQRGTGWIIGNGTASITQSVSFPVTFTSSAVTVVATPMGGVGSPSSEASFNAPGGVVICAGVGSISSAGFTIELNRATGNYSGSTYYGYNWIAIGTI